MATATGAERMVSLRENGFALIEDVADQSLIDRLLEELGSSGPNWKLARQGAVYGERNVLDKACAAGVCRSHAVREIVEAALGSGCLAVRGLFFDKVPSANWNLSWHQDVTIAVEERVDTPGFGPWSVKASVNHVHAPANVLENMLAVRIHLDDCPAENGALEVIPGSHLLGKLSQTQVSQFASDRESIVCAAPRGSALLMHPLLIHASKSAVRPAHRRVLHIEFAAVDLPGALKWRWRIGR